MSRTNFDSSVTRWFRCSEPSAVLAAASNKRLAKWLEVIDPVEVLDLTYNPENGHLNLLVQTGEAYGQCITRLDGLLEAVSTFTICMNNGAIFQSCATVWDEIITVPPRKIVN